MIEQRWNKSRQYLLKKNDFEYRDVSIFTSLFGLLALSGFQLQEQNRILELNFFSNKHFPVEPWMQKFMQIAVNVMTLKTDICKYY